MCCEAWVERVHKHGCLSAGVFSSFSQIVFTLETVPQSGRLEHELRGVLNVGDFFTQADINNNFIM